MNLAQINELMKASLDEYRCGFFGEDDLPEDVVLVEEDDWTQEHKYQYCSAVYKCPEGNYFEVSNNRSGSYHTDWYYGEPSVRQVTPVEKVVKTTEWVTV